MIRLRTLSALALLLGVVALFVPAIVTPQTTGQADLNIVIKDTLRAESDGAQPGEMMKIISGLNAVLRLQDKLSELNPQDTNGRAQIQQQIDTALTNLDSEANQLAITASQQSFMGRVFAYVLGGVGALISTFAVHCANRVRRIARRKRVLQMRIVPRERA